MIEAECILVDTNIILDVFEDDEEEKMLGTFGLAYYELPLEAFFRASKAYITYRQRVGTKTASLPDFFIGAHAATIGISILTRDVARYKTYFPEVELIAP